MSVPTPCSQHIQHIQNLRERARTRDHTYPRVTSETPGYADYTDTRTTLTSPREALP